MKFLIKKNLIIMVCLFLTLVYGCTDDGDSGDNINGLLFMDIIAPTATVSPESGSNITNNQQIVVSFNESININSLVLEGTMADESDKGVWSETTRAANNTLTISPATKWSDGTNKTLTIDCSDTAGNAMEQLSLTFTSDGTIPTASSVNPTTTSTIYDDKQIVIIFSESINTASLSMNGVISSEANITWSQTTNENDTLTISPNTKWTVGSNRNITIDANDITGNGLTQISLNYTVIGVVYVNIANSDTEDGSSANPYNTIQEGIDAADTAYSTAHVLVAEGTYYGTGSVVQMTEGISLYGGYQNGDWKTRDTSTYISTITDQKSTSGTDEGNPNRAVEFDGNSTAIISTTVIDGFTINGSDAHQSACIFIQGTASPTVQYCTLQAGSNNDGFAYYYFGVSVNGTSEPVIQYNTIKGGTLSTGGAYYLGVLAYSASSHPIVKNNVMYAAIRNSSGQVIYFFEWDADGDFSSIRENFFTDPDTDGGGTIEYGWDDNDTNIYDLDTYFTTMDFPSGDTTLRQMGNDTN